MFNFDKKIGEGSEIFFGKPKGIYDTIVVSHPRLQELYLAQRATDWMHNEFDLSKDREQLRSLDKGTRDLMLYNILFQWHLDSVAADNLFPLFAPFLTNSEASSLFSLNTSMEYVHSMTYSEIVRQCIPDHEELEKFIQDIEQVRKRLEPIFGILGKLSNAGCLYRLGEVSEDECYNILIKGLVTWWCMERIQFMSSFAKTFGVVRTGTLQGVGNYVQKIMLDEMNIHAETMKYVIQHEMKTNPKQWKDLESSLRKIVDTFVQGEYDWIDFVLSNGRGVSGLSNTLLKMWVDYNADDVYVTLFGDSKKQVDNPLKWMDNWLNPDKIQTANQEIANGNYLLGVVVDDVDGEIV